MGYSPGGHKRVGYDQAYTHTHAHTHTGVQSGRSSQTQPPREFSHGPRDAPCAQLLL